MLTKEEKELLTKVLCEQLPYGVFVKENRFSLDDGPVIYTPDYHPYMYDCKPYLRPMSSMTEEEKKIQNTYIYHFSGDNLPNYEGDFVFEDEVHEYIDWLNANHFDYRGLIYKGLAIAAVGKDNPYKEKGGVE